MLILLNALQLDKIAPFQARRKHQAKALTAIQFVTNESGRWRQLVITSSIEPIYDRGPGEMSPTLEVHGFELQASPRVYVAAIQGSWLLQHATPSWRIDDPEAGFQRIVREDRARQIAATVITQGRTFPNAIVLATDHDSFSIDVTKVILPADARFLVVDGQHRL
jgi:hypothetical protein